MAGVPVRCFNVWYFHCHNFCLWPLLWHVSQHSSCSRLHDFRFCISRLMQVLVSALSSYVISGNLVPERHVDFRPLNWRHLHERINHSGGQWRIQIRKEAFRDYAIAIHGVIVRVTSSWTICFFVFVGQKSPTVTVLAIYFSSAAIHGTEYLYIFSADTSSLFIYSD